jgi:tRNA threonylcarbamoyladenosine biosynthesis protein TsaB
MNILAFDSSIGSCSVALLIGDELISKVEKREMAQAERLVSLVDEVMESSNIGYADLDFVAVSRGPGSFTGIRIGIAAAKAFGLALDIPVMGFDNFQIVAQEARQKSLGEIIVLFEAGKGKTECYAAILSSDGCYVSEPKVMDYEQLVAVAKQGEYIIVGNISAELKSLLSTNHESLENINFPQAQHLAQLAKANHALPQKHPPTPLYLRKSYVD